MPSLFADTPRDFRRPPSVAAGHADGRIPLFMQRFFKGRAAPDLGQLRRRIILPSLPLADEDMARLSLWETGRHLARQDEWKELEQRIGLADDARLATPGGTCEARLLIDGAQSDVSAAAIHALEDEQVPDLNGLTALEEIAADHPESHAIAMVVAQAHLRIGWAWLSATNLSAGQHRTHFKRAAELLAPFDAEDLDAPSLAAMEAALAEYLAPDPATLVAAYQRLLVLDPDSPLHLRAFGLACQRAEKDEPAALGPYAAGLPPEVESVWGQGGYVWFHLDALKLSQDGLDELDVSRFTTGLRDILRLRPSQHFTNELAAFCALSMAPDQAHRSRSAEKARAQLHDCTQWILSDHLQELHPALWSDPDTLPGASPRHVPPRAHLALGRDAALNVIARLFAEQLADGSSIAFSPAGMYRLPSL